MVDTWQSCSPRFALEHAFWAARRLKKFTAQVLLRVLNDQAQKMNVTFTTYRENYLLKKLNESRSRLFVTTPSDYDYAPKPPAPERSTPKAPTTKRPALKPPSTKPAEAPKEKPDGRSPSTATVRRSRSVESRSGNKETRSRSYSPVPTRKSRSNFASSGSSSSSTSSSS